MHGLLKSRCSAMEDVDDSSSLGTDFEHQVASMYRDGINPPPLGMSEAA